MANCGKVLLYDTVFAGRYPESHARALISHVNEVFEVPEPLDVSRVMPAEMLAFTKMDHEADCVDPLGMSQ
jgi:hypothetical protein